MLEYSSREEPNMAVSEAQKRASRKYEKEHAKEVQAKRKERAIGLSVKLRKDEDSRYIEIFKSIPNKADYFRKCLDEYEKEHE